MIVKTNPTSNLMATEVRIPTGSVSLDRGVRFAVEAYNTNKIIVKKAQLVIPQLPNLLIGGVETNAFQYLLSEILSKIKLEFDAFMPNNPTANAKGVQVYVKPTETLNCKFINVLPGEISLVTGMKLPVEFRDAQEDLVDKQYLTINLPNVLINKIELTTGNYLKSEALKLIGLEEKVETI